MSDSLDYIRNSAGQNTGVGSCFLLQGIVPTQGLNLGLLHCSWILYQLSHQGIPTGDLERPEGSFLTSFTFSSKLVTNFFFKL